MASPDTYLDEGNVAPRRRRQTPTTPATAEEVEAALDAAAAELDADPATAQFEETQLFSPVGGGGPVAGASERDIAYFTREGYTAGPTPEKYGRFNAASIGWKLITNEDGSYSISEALPQGDADGGLQFPTYGQRFKIDPKTGEMVDTTEDWFNKNRPSSGPDSGRGTGTTGTTSSESGPGSEAYNNRKSAYDLLYAQFKQYGLESLVEPLKGLITSNTAPSEFIIKLRETDAYKKRFAGNAARVAKGLAAISEAEYIGLEDQYQNIMRNYGLPASYWEKDSMGTQAGFTNFIGNDVSAAELEDRIMTAQKRVINTNPQVSEALKQFYPEISNGDILAYTLDPAKGFDVIKRKITAAEIGGAALAQGLETGVTRAEELAKYGVTKEQAMQGYQTAAEVLPRGGQLAAIYGENPYTQQTAEQEIFGLAGSTEAAKQRRKLVGLERAAFSGQAGTTQGALGRERAGNL